MASWKLSLTAALALMFLLSGYAFDLELTPRGEVWSRVGEKVALSCRAKNCPSPSVKWDVVSDRLLAGTVRGQDSESIFTIDPVTVEKEQMYRCTAKCGGKRKQRNLSLHVYSLRDAVTLETVGSLQVGRKGTVRCIVPDVYPVHLTVQWLNETGVLETQEVHDHTGEIKNVTVTYELTPELQHSGQKLTCRVNMRTDEELQVEGTLTLDVHYPPRMINISAKPSLTVREGQDASLTCTADGNSPVTIVWSKLSADGWSMIAENQSTYQLSPTRIENSGAYRCEAINELGKSTTEVEFHVQGGPRDTRLSVTPSAVKEGDYVTISCTTHSNPPARLVLRRNLTSGQTELKLENGTFSIRAVQLADGGWYQCEASNDLGTQTIHTELIVQYPPKRINISAKPSLTVREGQDASLTCTADSSSPVTIVWSKLSADGWSVIAENQSTYQLSPTRIENSGAYRCEAINELGKSTTEVKFHVEGGPRDTRLSVTPSAVKEGDYVTISCTTHSNPPARLVLRRNLTSGQTELKSENGTFSIRAVQLADGGWYQCEASNDLGTQTIHTELIVQYPPKRINISAKPSLTVREDQDASLTCTADSSSPVTIVWSKLSADGWSVIAENQSTYQLSPTRIENSGAYRCEAINELGNSTTEVKFHVEEPDAVAKAESPVGVIASAYTGAAMGSVGLVLSGLYYIYRRTNVKNSYQMSNDIL
ncbi:vascular cell adhesion protein 1-like isoform X2 [Hemitrygon akajei]|uniref:vascular cell adhesion protein 1-like isoform X2 n=1 Tax=Hemitrygon akajei TaxID=2704970 RepID=UPI003BF94208